jgi:Zn-dependent peptidase ImmA (M78 family)/transcriptional regulator with XRE-family HTH domain
MADKAMITPKVLAWARTTAGMTIDVSAAKASVEISRLMQWEKGEAYPTMHQAELLAKAYRRPLALFFLPDIPYDFTPLKDFRAQKSGPLSTASIFIIREMQQKQEWISASLRENGEKPLPFIGKYTTKNSPTVVANDILETLGISPGFYSSEAVMKQWIRKAEDHGIFISRASFIHSHLLLDSEEMQGFAISDPYAPFVFINSEDWASPQLFTLVHELAHLWIATSGISNDIEQNTIGRSNIHPTELFCNEVAAHALMPKSYMEILSENTFSDEDKVVQESQKLGISSFAFLLRAKNMNIITEHKYSTLKRKLDIGFKKFLEREATKKATAKLKTKEKSGGPNANLLLTYRNGLLFTKIVIDAFRGGQLPPTEASNLLNTKVSNFWKLEAFLW